MNLESRWVSVCWCLLLGLCLIIAYSIIKSDSGRVSVCSERFTIFEEWNEYRVQNNLTYVNGSYNCKNFTNDGVSFFNERGVPIQEVIVNRSNDSGVFHSQGLLCYSFQRGKLIPCGNITRIGDLICR